MNSATEIRGPNAKEDTNDSTSDDAFFSSRWKRRFLIVGALAFGVKLWLAWVSPGTQDVGTWGRFVRDFPDIGGLGIYHKPYTSFTFFNHPPFILHFVQIVGWLTRATDWPMRFFLRLAPSTADVGSAVVLWKIAQGRARGNDLGRDKGQLFSPRAFLLYLAAPALVGISGFHGNTDAILIFFVLLAVLLLERKAALWKVGVAFGMALSIKAAAMLFVPVFLLYLPNWRQRIEYSMAAAATFFIAGLPYMAQEPRLILQHVFGYGGQYGIWGLTRLMRLAPPTWELDSFILHFSRPALAIAMFAFAFWMNRKSRREPQRQKPDLLRQLALLMLLFFAVTPSFAVQYFAWIVPLTLALDGIGFTIFYLTSSVFVGMTHGVCWARLLVTNFPVQLWIERLITLELICWLSVVLVFIAETRRLAQEQKLASSRKSQQNA